MAEEKKSPFEDMEAIIMEDDEGNKKSLQIYFTYHSDKFNRDYVVFFDPDNEDDLLSAWADENGELHDLETDEEFEELSQIVDEYQSDNK
jgi:uncharacterized protein YrzB (UPF0473 family)